MTVEIERDAVHWMLRSRPARSEGVRTLNGTDFSDITCGHIFGAVRALHDNGAIVEPSTVARVAGCNIDTINKLWFDRHPFGTDRQCFSELVSSSRRRRTFALVEQVMARKGDPSLSDEWIANALDDAHTLALPREALTSAVENIDQMIEDTDTQYKWLMPWMLERGERLMIVAPEGSGKTVLLRQWAFQGACGCHWATGRITPKFSTLYIDAENSRVNTVRAARKLHYRAKRYAGDDWDGNRLRIKPIHNLNLVQDRRQRDEVEQWIELYRPDLLVIGPIYKIGRNTPGFSFEDNALAFTDIVDDWRHRYDLAVAMEHHAPKAIGSDGNRDLGPFGSSVWKRWPDIGISLSWHPEDEDISVPRFDVSPFRGFRGTHHFPTRFLHGDLGRDNEQWPWMPHGVAPSVYERGDEYASF